ncbi:MAG: hypothetical protein WC511_02050 [Candidatus Pacearchaeota archaeon]
MAVCCCSLAGTAACMNCPNKPQPITSYVEQFLHKANGYFDDFLKVKDVDELVEKLKKKTSDKKPKITTEEQFDPFGKVVSKKVTIETETDVTVEYWEKDRLISRKVSTK